MSIGSATTTPPSPPAVEKEEGWKEWFLDNLNNNKAWHVIGGASTLTCALFALFSSLSPSADFFKLSPGSGGLITMLAFGALGGIAYIIEEIAKSSGSKKVESLARRAKWLALPAAAPILLHILLNLIGGLNSVLTLLPYTGAVSFILFAAITSGLKLIRESSSNKNKKVSDSVITQISERYLKLFAVCTAIAAFSLIIATTSHLSGDGVDGALRFFSNPFGPIAIMGLTASVALGLPWALRSEARFIPYQPHPIKLKKLKKKI